MYANVNPNEMRQTSTARLQCIVDDMLQQAELINSLNRTNTSVGAVMRMQWLLTSVHTSMSCGRTMHYAN